jgi:hypothetical protein
MTSQDYKDLAKANGYDLGVKTDEELLADYAFHKAACASMEDEVFASAKNTDMAVASLHKPYRVRFMIALDGLDTGKAVGDIWLEVCAGNPKKSDVTDANGNLIAANL